MQVLIVALVALCGSSWAQRALPTSSFIYPSAPLLPIAPLFEYSPAIRRAPFAESRITVLSPYPARSASGGSDPVGSPGSRPGSRPGSQVNAVHEAETQHYYEKNNPCDPTPCGPFTICQVTSRSGKEVALCKCQPNYVPDGHTIKGCKRQCTSDFECPAKYYCDMGTYKCDRLCKQNDCGIDADCVPQNHKSVCKCPIGYLGNPDVSCSRGAPQSDPVPLQLRDPCVPNPCGQNARCRGDGIRAVCVCLERFEGDPLTGCSRSECITSDHCPRNLACQRRKCINPCGIPKICGTNTDCSVSTHQPVCSCSKGHVGDPFIHCRKFDPEELCRPTPCGKNTNCRVQNDRAVCTCITNYLGDPLRGCRPECEIDSDCQRGFACSNNRCVNPCRSGICGQGALCDVRHGQAVCSCPEYYLGNANIRCYPECTTHEMCPSHKACYQLKCIDPCDDACGTGAICRVENHKPICSCPKGYTGHPFDACVRFDPAELCRPNPCGRNADCTPGHDREGNDRPVCTCPIGYVGNPLHGCTRGDCEDSFQCPDNQACYKYKCQTACYTDTGEVCGQGADCTMKNHRPVCSCPKGYNGNPLVRCNVDAHSRFIVGRSKNLW